MSRSALIIAILFLLVSANAQDPSKAASLNQRGLKLFKEGKFDAAIEAFSKAIEVSSMIVSRRNDIADSSLAALQPHESLASPVTAVDPRTAAALVNRGNVYFVIGDFDSAQRDYERALRISPGLAEAHACRGSLLLGKGDIDAAIEDFSRSVKIDPRFIKGYLGRSLAYATKGDIKAALADLDSAEKIDPKNGEVYYRRGDTMRISGDSDAAFVEYDRAIAIDPKLAGPYFARGFILYTKRLLEPAIKNLTMALERDARMPDAYMFRGYALLALGKDAEAEKDFQRALAIQPQLASSIDEGVKMIKSQRE